jgi:hypothetical protein
VFLYIRTTIDTLGVMIQEELVRAAIYVQVESAQLGGEGRLSARRARLRFVQDVRYTAG